MARGLVMALKVARKLEQQRQADVMWDNFRSLIALQFLDGKVFDIDSLSSGADTYELIHGLGRVPTGWMLLGGVQVSGIYVSASDNTTLTIEYTGQGSGDRTLRVLVY